MPVEDVAIAPYGLLIDFVVVAFGKGDMYAVLGGGKQGVVHGQQYVEGLGGTREEEVAAEGDLPDIHLPADVEGLLPVGRKCGDIVFRHMDIVQ
jgi:hypothetical protein